jgi:hypothetical protein
MTRIGKPTVVRMTSVLWLWGVPPFCQTSLRPAKHEGSPQSRDGCSRSWPGVAGAGAAKRTAAERDGFATGEAVTCLSHSCNEFFSIAIAKGA